jgi:eukaryotic-like serine/threonine-protein kinase
VLSLLDHVSPGTEAPPPGAAPPAQGLTLSQPAWTQLPGLQAAPPALQRGHALGAWEITALIGKGGMGEVYEARRADGSWAGRAAVKVLSPDLVGGSFMQRFQREREALARLDHPHIARLLDAGTTASGLPYLVMEYVEHARPINRATVDEPLSTRLGLLLQLASALAHSHESMLLHCDVKPGNVLVDGRGRVRLLDFGIAKALQAPADGSPRASAQVTSAGPVLPMTPRYASPEQLRGGSVGVASDVYSFGVLAFEVLTGRHPTSVPELSAADAVAATLTLLPPAASAAVPAGAKVSAAQLRGDLDAILAKALEKDVAQRYGSMAALAGDLSAVLQGHPISLRATQAGYLFRHLVRRHRAAALALGMGLVGLFTGLGSALVQGQWAWVLGASGMAIGLGVALRQARRAAQAYRPVL